MLLAPTGAIVVSNLLRQDTLDVEEPKRAGVAALVLLIGLGAVVALDTPLAVPEPQLAELNLKGRNLGFELRKEAPAPT